MAKPEPISKRELKISLGVITLIIAVLLLSSLLLFTPYWFVWPIILAGLLVTIGYTTASKNFYGCPSCKKEFKISALQDFFAPHGISRGPKVELYEWKVLKCPDCHNRQKCFRVKPQEER
jgi:hypothetical protein